MNAATQEYSIVQMLLDKEKSAPNQVYLRQPRHDVWREYTWKEVIEQARKVAGFLYQTGLKKGDHVSIISKNCAEWFITDFGITMAGMVNVPLFANQHKESIEYVLEHGEVKMVFVGKLDNHQLVRSYIPASYKTVCFDFHDDLKTDYHWKDVLAVEPLQDIVMPEPHDMYTIIYTSGTTGAPKGAVYDHGRISNYLRLFMQDFKRISQTPKHHLISYLPLAHIYERSAVQLASLGFDCDVSFVESLDKFGENLKEVQPTLFTAVPRIWGVFQQKIEAKLPPAKMNLLLKIPLISSLIKKKIRHQLGLSRCECAFSGASHLPVSILSFFDKLGVSIREGYGQTENMAYVTLTMPETREYGYVGTPRIGVSLKKGEMDELLVKSDCLMNGYYKNQSATDEALTEDGWLKTGDVVELDPLNRVKILGRISETFKNQKGEFITPGPIEKMFSSNTMIEQLCLIGQGLPNNVMVVSLNDGAKKKSQSDVRGKLQKTLGKVNAELANYEKISHVLVVQEGWTPENDLLTPTLKVKRRRIAEHYGDFIQSAIADHNPVVFEVKS